MYRAQISNLVNFLFNLKWKTQLLWPPIDPKSLRNTRFFQLEKGSENLSPQILGKLLMCIGIFTYILVDK